MPAHLFFACAKNNSDRDLLDELLTQLKPLHRDGYVTWWHEAAPGEDTTAAREVNLLRADLILLIVSPDLNADLRYSTDVAAALLRRQKIIPILARPCMWERESYGALQPLPRNQVWISRAHRDEALSEVARAIEEEVRSIAPPPPHVAYHPRWYVERVDEEHRALDYLQHPGQPVVILGDRQAGKTWTLKRLLDLVYQLDRRSSIVEIDLDLFPAYSRSSLGAFLTKLGEHIVAQLEIKQDSASRISTGDPELDLKELLQRTVFPSVVSKNGLLYLAIDQADTVWNRPFRDDFFRMLRSWTQTGTRTYDAHSRLWSSLRLLLAISTPPHQLVANLHQSPFNLTEPIQMLQWTETQVRQLAFQYSIGCGTSEAEWVRRNAGTNTLQMRRIMLRAIELGLRHLSQLMAASVGES